MTVGGRSVNENLKNGNDANPEDLLFINPETKDNYMNYRKLNKMRKNPVTMMSNVRLEEENNVSKIIQD